MNVLAELRRRFAVALAPVVGDAAVASELSLLVLPSQDSKFGDYQANCAMPLAKRLGKPPREVADEIVQNLALDELCEPPDIAGPGFINLRLKDQRIAEALSAAVEGTERLGVARAAVPRTFVVDYSSPNVAKPMHVGHIRSTVIGDALYRVLGFLGHRVISDNHIGDWGTQFGMIIYGYKHFVDEREMARAPLSELTRLYKLVNQLVEFHVARQENIPATTALVEQQQRRVEELREAGEPEDRKEAKQASKRLNSARQRWNELQDELAALHEKTAAVESDAKLSELASQHPDIAPGVLAETAALHSGDPVNRQLWEQFLPACLEDIDATYRRLEVVFDHTLGESFYSDQLAGVIESLEQRGLARESEGAICVFLEGHDSPFIVRKQDGAYLYSTTDLATIQYRMQTWRPDAILYVVDHRQSLHFQHLFATAKKLGYEEVELQHVSFGTVLGDDGRPFKTRSGSSVGLTGLLQEAVDRAYAIAAKSDVLESEAERLQVAERIGIGAVKYADLSHNRTSDYKFSYDKMLAMNGNTAAYMQYCYARARGIFARGDVDVEQIRDSDVAISLAHPAERELALALLRFSESLDRVVGDYRPNHLTDYLFDLASRYAAFFEQCPVLKAGTDALRTSRLLLCDLTARTIQRGLSLLGIETVERM
ncbi:MAG: arginine--tRNA ligase [Planctomycetota bacterium]